MSHLPLIRPGPAHRSVAAALALALLGGGAAYSTASRHADAEARLLQTQHALTDVRTRLQVAEDTLAARQKQLSAAAQLRAQGLSAGPDRPAWLKAVRAELQAQHLASLDVELGPHRPLDGAADFDASPLTLRGPLAHEGQLLRLLDVLDRQPGTLLLPRRCRVSRLDTTDAPDERLHADCQLEFVTLTPLAAAVP